MSKEMFISSSPHETKVAVLEDDQLVEVYFERDTDVGLVGGIYKGRVSRVLPGMQSAFVDIGLERDAFLYVSDFYEDQEEYDKVFEEAEARATKLTAQEGEAVAAPPVSVAAEVIEPAPPVVAEVAPPPMAAPTEAPRAEPSVATVAPSAPTTTASTPRESHDRRPFDPRRGRRRRHRGRTDFREHRNEDRRFPPSHRAEEPPTESYTFEVLPGESLAKYSHTAATPGTESETDLATGLLAAAEGVDGRDEDTISGTLSSQDDHSEAQASGVEADTMSWTSPSATDVQAQPAGSEPPVAPAAEGEPLPEPAAESSAIKFPAPAEVSGQEPARRASSQAPPAATSAQAPAAAVAAVVTDAAVSFAPSATQATASSGDETGISPEAAEAPALASAASAPTPPEEPIPLDLAPPAPDTPGSRLEPGAEIPASPASPSYAAEVAASYSVEGIAAPASGEPEPKGPLATAPAEAPPKPEQAPATSEGAQPVDLSEGEAASAASATEEVDTPSDRAKQGGLNGDSDDEEEESEEGDDLDEGAEDELDEEGEASPEGESEAEAGEDEVQPAVPQATAGEVVAVDVGSGASADRTYTLREPHQRPRFAPRGRRRGRRGPGGDRGPRRFDKPRDSSRPGNHQPVQISEVLKEGQEILVQIAKEPLGSKGARITSHVALPGRYLVYMPTIAHIGVSRKIVSEEERLRLRNMILENKGALTGGFIVRTAGQGRSEEEFKADLTFLSTLWAEIRSQADRLKAPALLHRDLDLVQRLLRDLLTPDFKTVRVDSEIDYERVLDFVNRCQPALVGKVKLYSRDTPLYEEFGIQQEIDKALKPKVWLKSGGYIVINQTEALVAIDVNTGKYVGKTNRLEDTIVKTNVDAVNEIVRQVRLRDLGGIIVIDFIDMDERKNRAKVVQALEEALRSDRAPTKVISFHDFGLVAVTRKRVKQSLERTLCEPCNYCTGSGWVKSVHTICNEILAEARKMAREIDGHVMTLRVNPEVARALKSREGGLLSELESLTKKDVIIKSDPMVHQERFEIF
jgi:ribonuclease G